MNIRSNHTSVIFLCILLLAPVVLYADITSDQRAALQAQLNQVEQDILHNESNLGEKQKQRASLERDLSILDGKIKAAQLGIKARDLNIKQIKNGIGDKEQSIRTLDNSVSAGQASIAKMIRETRVADDVSLVETVLGGTLNDVIQKLDSFQIIQSALGDSFKEIAVTRSDLSSRKDALEQQKQDEQNLLRLQTLENSVLKDRKKDKKDLVESARGDEKLYKKIIADKKQTAAEIRRELFGLRDSAAIPFPTAYQYAKDASARTGVRAAFILAILTQESDFGVNVGSCYVKDIQTGSGIGKNTGKVFSSVMKSPRDTVPFQQITENLGRDWSNTPVSCPQGSGYGGAMGPSQFIPSTWISYKDRIANLTGGGFPNPWDPRTAIFATAIYMMDLGADNGTRTSERTAALKYFAGGNWNKRANAFYGDQVMENVDKMQEKIDILGK
jgi:membrane-bound lytic murein transglycosylase B